MLIDLRSDTFTLTSAAMREVMARAEEGDDYYGEDKSVNRLQDYCKELTTGQKFDNFPPDSNIEALEFGH